MALCTAGCQTQTFSTAAGANAAVGTVGSFSFSGWSYDVQVQAGNRAIYKLSDQATFKVGFQHPKDVPVLESLMCNHRQRAGSIQFHLTGPYSGRGFQETRLTSLWGGAEEPASEEMHLPYCAHACSASVGSRSRSQVSRCSPISDAAGWRSQCSW